MGGGEQGHTVLGECVQNHRVGGSVLWGSGLPSVSLPRTRRWAWRVGEGEGLGLCGGVGLRRGRWWSRAVVAECKEAYGEKVREWVINDFLERKAGRDRGPG